MAPGKWFNSIYPVSQNTGKIISLIKHTKRNYILFKALTPWNMHEVA